MKPKKFKQPMSEAAKKAIEKFKHLFYANHIPPELNISNIRKILMEEDDLYVHDEQIVSAIEIFIQMYLGYRYIVLTAPMQAGKTGVLTTILHVLFNNYIPVEGLELIKAQKRFLIASAINDNVWKEQTADRVYGQVSMRDGKGTKEIADEHILHMTDLAVGLSAKDEKINQLIRKVSNGNLMLFIDESHIGHSKRSTIDKLLKRIGISGNGNPEKLKEKNVFVVAISATPFHEMINDENRKIVEMLVSDKYYGLYKMYQNKKLLNSWGLGTKNGRNRLITTIRNFTLGKSGYMLVRAKGTTHEKLYNELKKAKIKVVKYDASNKKNFNIDNINTFLGEKNDVPCVVLVKDYLRVAQTLTKDALSNILFTFDTTDSFTDTAAQSLVGRCCNYHGINHIVHFGNMKAYLGYIKWELDKDKGNVPRAKGLEEYAEAPKLPKDDDSDFIWEEATGMFKFSNVPQSLIEKARDKTKEWSRSDIGINTRTSRTKQNYNITTDFVNPLIELVKKNIVDVDMHTNFLPNGKTAKELFLEMFAPENQFSHNNVDGQLVPIRLRTIANSLRVSEYRWLLANLQGESSGNYGMKKRNFEGSKQYTECVPNFIEKTYFTVGVPKIDIPNNIVMKEGHVYIHTWKPRLRGNIFDEALGTDNPSTKSYSLSHITNQ